MTVGVMDYSQGHKRTHIHAHTAQTVSLFSWSAALNHLFYELYSASFCVNKYYVCANVCQGTNQKSKDARGRGGS